MQSFTVNGNPVWEPRFKLKDIPLFSLGEKDLSFNDVSGLNKLYKCNYSKFTFI